MLRYRLRTLMIVLALVALFFAAYRYGYERGMNKWRDESMKHGDPFDMSGK
jgi:hypothetical protein